MIAATLRTIIRINNRRKGKRARLCLPLLRPGYEEGGGKSHEHLKLLRISPFEIAMFDETRDSLRVLRIIGDAESEVQSLEIKDFRALACHFVANFESERFLDKKSQVEQQARLARMREKSDRWKKNS